MAGDARPRKRASMARKVVPTERSSCAWKSLFGFSPDLENHEAVGRLKDLGVEEVEFRRFRTAAHEHFTDLTLVVAGKGTAVTVAWFKQVRDQCLALAPAIDPEVQRVAGPDGDDPDTDLREAVAEGDLLVHVRVSFRKDTYINADVKFPSVECGSPVVIE